MLLDSEKVLSQHGGTRANDLNDKLALYDEEANEVATISHSPYMTHDMVPRYLSDHQDSFSVMSLNCQSINAKFGQIEAILLELQRSNFMFSVICLQETWLSSDSSTAGPRFNIKTVLSAYGDFHVKDKTAVRTSYL